MSACSGREGGDCTYLPCTPDQVEGVGLQWREGGDCSAHADRGAALVAREEALAWRQQEQHAVQRPVIPRRRWDRHVHCSVTGNCFVCTRVWCLEIVSLLVNLARMIVHETLSL